jgi:small conductance mechanosensitive channel
MFRSLFALVLSVGFLSNPIISAAEAAADSKPQPSAQVAPADGAKNAPASGTTAAANSPAEAETIGQIFGRTSVGQLFEGKKKVTLEDARNPFFWLETARDLVMALLGFIPRIIVAGLFLVFFWLVYRTVRRVVVGSMKSAGVDASIQDMLGRLIKWSVMGFGVVIACNQIGIQIAALLTGVSIVGLAVGFAAQETLANFIAGIVIFMDKPFRIGDWVEVDSTYGQIERVTFRSTRIITGAGEIVVYPNTHMLASKLSNHTTHPVTRVRVDIGIAYKESIAAAREVLLSIVKDDERISTEHEASVAVTECASSSVNLALFFWVTDESIERAMKSEYLEKAKNAFDDAGIAIPFPHVQLVMEKDAGTLAMPVSAELRKVG